MSDNRSSYIQESAVHVIQTTRRHIQEVRNLYQVRIQNFSLGGADPEAIYNLFDLKNYVIKIM